MPPSHCRPYRHQTDDRGPLLRAFIGFAHPLRHGLAIRRITPANACPRLGETIVFTRAIPCTCGMVRLRGSVKRTATCCIEICKEVVRRFSCRAASTMGDVTLEMLGLALALTIGPYFGCMVRIGMRGVRLFSWSWHADFVYSADVDERHCPYGSSLGLFQPIFLSALARRPAPWDAAGRWP